MSGATEQIRQSNQLLEAGGATGRHGFRQSGKEMTAMIPHYFSLLESFAPEHSVQYENHQIFADDVSRFGQSLNLWEPLDKEAAFSAKLIAFQSDDVALAAFLFPKIRTEVGANETHNLAIPLLGHNTSRTNGKDFAWGSSIGALYSPAGSSIRKRNGSYDPGGHEAGQ